MEINDRNSKRTEKCFGRNVYDWANEIIFLIFNEPYLYLFSYKKKQLYSDTEIGSKIGKMSCFLSSIFLKKNHGGLLPSVSFKWLSKMSKLIIEFAPPSPKSERIMPMVQPQVGTSPTSL